MPLSRCFSIRRSSSLLELADVEIAVRRQNHTVVAALDVQHLGAPNFQHRERNVPHDRDEKGNGGIGIGVLDFMEILKDAQITLADRVLRLHIVAQNGVGLLHQQVLLARVEIFKFVAVARRRKDENDEQAALTPSPSDYRTETGTKILQIG